MHVGYVLYRALVFIDCEMMFQKVNAQLEAIKKDVNEIEGRTFNSC